MSVCWTKLFTGVKFPTAQAWPELGSAAAPLRLAAEPGLGLTMLHAVPSQCSVRVWKALLAFWNRPPPRCRWRTRL